MATLDNDDLNAIKGLIEVTFDEKLDEKLDDKLSHIPTKDEFYTKMDEVMGELKAIREEQTVQGQHLSAHDDRIEKIESRLGISSNWPGISVKALLTPLYDGRRINST